MSGYFVRFSGCKGTHDTICHPHFTTETGIMMDDRWKRLGSGGRNVSGDIHCSCCCRCHVFKPRLHFHVLCRCLITKRCSSSSCHITGGGPCMGIAWREHSTAQHSTKQHRRGQKSVCIFMEETPLVHTIQYNTIQFIDARRIMSRAGATDHCVTPSKEGPWFELSSRTRSCAHEPHTVTTRDKLLPP
jgi:hypothetical protein